MAASRREQILGWDSVAAHNPETGAVFVAYVNEYGALPAVSGPALGAFPDRIGLFGG